MYIDQFIDWFVEDLFIEQMIISFLLKIWSIVGIADGAFILGAIVVDNMMACKFTYSLVLNGL